MAQAERLGTLAHLQYLRSDYAWTLLVLAPALTAGRAFRGDVAKVRESLDLLAKAGLDTRWPELATRAIVGDLDGLHAGLAGLEVQANPGPSYSAFDLAFAALHVEVSDITGDGTLARAALGPLQAAHAAGFAQVLGWVASVPRLLGVACRCLGNFPEAETWLRTAIAQAQQAPAPAEVARAQLNLAEVLVAVGDEQGGAVALDDAVSAFRRLGLPALLNRSEHLQVTLSRARSKE
jgi:hypothetical protein